MSPISFADDQRDLIQVRVDGVLVEGRAGQSVLTLVLGQQGKLRSHEVSGEPRAGFCLMGACQDCWIWLSDRQRGRACTTPAFEGMSIFTVKPRREA